MSNGDAVARKVIVALLREHETIVQKTRDGYWILAKGDVMEKRRLKDYHHRNFLHYLSRTFGVPIHLFFNPPATLVVVEDEQTVN